ncbi:hypothetical protein H2203_006236 [Taxawa tesnikishii (nom. ined.)]|nr:hypothetical protein H2203_006236 [Dothideales sp. JES 119]
MSTVAERESKKRKRGEEAGETASTISKVNGTSAKNAEHVANVRRWHRVRISEQEDHSRLYSLIVDYVQNPQLATSVKELVFRGHHVEYEYPPRRQMAGEGRLGARDALDNKALIEVVKVLVGEDAVGEWVRALSWARPERVEARKLNETRAWADGNWQTMRSSRRQHALFGHYAAALLIALCPNIEALTLEDSATTDVLGMVLRKNNHSLLKERYLQKLKHVKLLPTTEIILCDPREYTTTDFLGLVGLFNRLPSLESISIDGIQEDGKGSDRWLIAPHTSNVKSIHIGHSDLSSAMLASVIRLSTALEDFTFSTGGRAIYGNHVIYPKTLGKALLCQKHSLRRLDLDLDAKVYARPGEWVDEDGMDPNDPLDLEAVDYMRDEWFLLNEANSSGPLFTKDLADTREYGGTMGSFHDFTALTDLSIGVRLLLGAGEESAPFRLTDSLPPSLESLVLRGYRRGEMRQHDKQIDDFLRMKSKRFPFLREIKGIDSPIPNGEDVRDPDNNEGELWVRPDEDDDWQ